MPIPAGTSPTEEIKSRLDIVDVIQEYLQLKPGGANWRANCPFHQEKTPSFMVSREKQIWHCFGCNEGGDVITFVQKMEGMEFPEALRMLAKKANVELPTFNPQLQNQKTRLLDILKAASNFFQETLRSPAGETARAYLRERNVSDETIEDFQIGVAPDSWDALNTFLVQKKFSAEDIFQAGLSVKRERGQGYYDRFRKRIMFPLIDVHGSVVGFGGRVLDTETEGAKYINSPQTAVYDKSGFLYGLDKAKQSIREKKVAVIVEGYMDVVASHQAGVKNVVASSGTALTERQVRLLKRYTSSIALAFDADLAGSDASQRGIDVALREELDVRVVTLPFGKDPDEVIKKDPAAWLKATESSLEIMEYTLAHAQKGKDLTKLADKKALASSMLRALGWVSDPIVHAHYLQKLSQLVNVEEHILRDKFLSIRKPGDRGPKRQDKGTESLKPSTDKLHSLGERVLSFLLKRPDLIAEAVHIPPEAFAEQGLSDLYKYLQESYTTSHEINPETLEHELKAQHPSLASRAAVLLMRADHELAVLGEEDFKKDLIVCIRQLQWEWYSRELQRVVRDIGDAERRHDAEAISKLSSRHKEITDHLQSLSIAL